MNMLKIDTFLSDISMIYNFQLCLEVISICKKTYSLKDFGLLEIPSKVESFSFFIFSPKARQLIAERNCAEDLLSIIKDYDSLSKK